MEKPKILFLGNGINKAFGADSWEELLGAFGKSKKIDRGIPFPLQPILLSENNVQEKIKKLSEEDRLYGCVKSNEMMQLLQQILSAGFDDIITTNYSYELESAAFGVERISDSRLDVIRRTNAPRAEGAYFLKTYNEVIFNGHKTRIWHIHGAAKNPSSIVIGHYYYGNLLAKYKQYFDFVGNAYQRAEKEGNPFRIHSWLDAFVLGNIKCIGFGFDVGEFDLWWLLDRKKREKASHGTFQYYAPSWEHEANEIKYKLMRCFDIEIRDRKLKIPEQDYIKYYNSVLQRIDY